MQIFNTLTRKKEEFVPMKEGEYRIYVCGPTVYNYIHIGNARPAIVFDTLRRYLEYRGNKVLYVSNVTDIDDKLIRRAIDDAAVQGRKGLVLTCKEEKIHYYAKFGFVNEGVSSSVHGGAVWYQMRLRFL